MPEVILPCPECHSLSVGLCSGTDEITHELYNQAFCTSCGVSGPKVFADEISAISAWNALPRPLTWTHEPPKVAGWYWMRQQGESFDLMQHYSQADIDRGFDNEMRLKQWAGPIAPPVEG